MTISASARLETEFSIPREAIHQGITDAGTLASMAFTNGITNVVVNGVARGAASSAVKGFIKNEAGGIQLPKVISGREMVKKFEEIGYELRPRTRGSHMIMDKPGSLPITIPDHNVLATGTAHSLWKKYKSGSQPGVNASAPALKPTITYDQPLPNRLDYSGKYFDEAKNFVEPPKEFIGVLSRDLTVINYNNGGRLVDGKKAISRTVGAQEAEEKVRRIAWAMVPAEANYLNTLEEVQNYLSLLNKFQDYTHVSVARIPAGEPVRFLHGRAAQQIDAVANEIRLGGGVQYRFFDFDPKWVVETRELPR